MTFSIVGHCSQTSQLGVAVCSSSMAVAARCAHARSKIGAVATQNITDPGLGPRALELMANGYRPRDIIQAFDRTEEFLEYRQLVLINCRGETAVFSGERTLGTHGEAEGPSCAAAGNLLARADVPQRMVDAFGKAHGDLGDKLLAAMQEGLAAGGEAGPVHSAGLLIVHEESWPIVDLRVDWADEEPLAMLGRLWERWRPQMDDYITRALDPASAPGFGVPGET